MTLRRVDFQSFNSQPPEGGWLCPIQLVCSLIGFNSQPPEGGWVSIFDNLTRSVSFNSQPPEGGWMSAIKESGQTVLFQLTAARRRLAPPLKPLPNKACIALFR